MKKNLSFKTISILSSILLFITLCASLPFPWNDTINETIIDWQFKIRGDRSLSEDFVFVFIGDKDLKALDGWPISRDYYSYLIYILNQSGTKTIGLDVLFSRPDTRHPEYDRILEQFLDSASNVCLPFTFSALSPTEKNTVSGKLPPLTGLNPTFPLDKFHRSAARIGYSNFSRVPIIQKVPLAVHYEDSVTFSFGLELANLYLESKKKAIYTQSGITLQSIDADPILIKTDERARIRLNHFGDLANIQAISAIDLMKAYENNPDSLDFKNKLAFIAVTASGVANLKATPLSAGLPASLIHLTITENCLNQNYIRELSLYTQWFIILLLIILAFITLSIKNTLKRVLSTGIIFVVYLLLAMVVFSQLNFAFPIFYPLLAMLTVTIYFYFLKITHKKSEDTSHFLLLKEQIRSKEDDLEEARDKLKEMARELQKESMITDQTQQLAEERKETIQRLENELNDLNAYIIDKTTVAGIDFPELIYSENSKMKQVIDLVNKIRADDIPVLISGETGTGKEMIARAIHQISHRQNAAFIAINCGALSENLLESELFGHEKGSFTGAQAQRRGRFEIADGGTIFLDEITETSTAFQTRLLRVLQDNSFERLGGEKTLKTNVRIIAASNKNISEEIEQSRFRTDLYYRLNGFPINLPSLRERTEDIPLLVSHFLQKHKFEKLTGISEQAMNILQSYAWPGNVRELENSIRRAAILAQSENRELLQEKDLPAELTKRDLLLDRQTIHKPLEDQILEMLQSLKFSHTAISQTARALGNRDRGTITEYFRGICFEQLVNDNFNIDTAAKNIAATTDKLVVERVHTKLEEYLNNLKMSTLSENVAETDKSKLPPAYRGLPKKYHTYLDKVRLYLLDK